MGLVQRDDSEFEFQQAIGEGGFCKVDLAKQRDGALVVIRSISMRNPPPDVQQRFIEEANLLAQIDHPSIIKTFGLVMPGDTNNVPKLVLEYLERGDLRECRDTLSKEELVSVILCVADALHHIHQLGLVHGDV
jgi:serine/threonine protein kinase